MQHRFMTTGLLAAAMMIAMAPLAAAEPVPGPEPVPIPAPPTGGDSDGLCQAGEVMHYGNCIPAMTPVNTDPAGEAEMTVPLRLSESHTSTIESGLPSDLVPNINGTPCTGYWMSTACYAENMGDSAPEVVPRSTFSSSP